LPEVKRQAVLLYYFFDMKDAEIAELMKIPRSTVQFRRTSSFELLKRFLEEKADEWKARLAACGRRQRRIYNDTPLPPQSERSERRRQWAGLHENHAGVKLP
jgi:hypothetical protein